MRWNLMKITNNTQRPVTSVRRHRRRGLSIMISRRGNAPVRKSLQHKLRRKKRRKTTVGKSLTGEIDREIAISEVREIERGKGRSLMQMRRRYDKIPISWFNRTVNRNVMC